MKREQVETIVAVLKLLKDAENKAIQNGQAVAKETGDSTDELKHDVNRWELVMAQSFLMQLLKEESSPELIRDLYCMDIVVTGWSVSWKPTSVEEQIADLKAQRFLADFPYDPST